MLDVNEFDSMRIGLASPEKIREWSHGEVTKPETINYRTLKPEKDGLFCERIFGPQKDWECHCGKYKRIRNKGVICDKCGVEVTRAKVRRERMAHIELASPVSHIWYFKGIPSRMGLILDISPKALERILYYVAYVVLDPGKAQTAKVEEDLRDLEMRVNTAAAEGRFPTPLEISKIRIRLSEELASQIMKLMEDPETYDAFPLHERDRELLRLAEEALADAESNAAHLTAELKEKEAVLKKLEQEISGGKSELAPLEKEDNEFLESFRAAINEVREKVKKINEYLEELLAQESPLAQGIKSAIRENDDHWQLALLSEKAYDEFNKIIAAASEDNNAELIEQLGKLLKDSLVYTDVEMEKQDSLSAAAEKAKSKLEADEYNAVLQIWNESQAERFDELSKWEKANVEFEKIANDIELIKEEKNSTEKEIKKLKADINDAEKEVKKAEQDEEELQRKLESALGRLPAYVSEAVENVLTEARQKFDNGLIKKGLLSEMEYRDAERIFGPGSFDAKIGAEGVKELLAEIDLDQLDAELREELNSSSGQRRIRAVRRLEVVEAFRKSGNRPEWMILDCIPVIPPELRPMVQLDGGRFATSDLNDLYRRVINRNNRLKRLLELRAPEIIVRNEKRMLQEAVDALIDNGRRGRAVVGPGNRPLKSLSDLLKGKQGRFRQNLLGKRVDYSGRSVIVVGPELKMHQCGLPKEMALELFKPFVMRELIERDKASNIKSAKKKVEKAVPEVWDILEDVIHEHPVLLNRAPTLHRLGIQAFEPILWEGRAIKLHPLVCAAYNADFDGDQMACHLPLSVEAQSEARTLMLSVNNILSTKDGKPVAVPSQDMVLGAYYLTMDKAEEYPAEKEKVSAYRYAAAKDKEREKMVSLPAFADIDEVLMAYDQGYIDLHEYVFVRLRKEENGERQTMLTTCGRVIFNKELPYELRYYTEVDGFPSLGILMDKKELAELIDQCFQKFGMARTAELLDKVKTLGFSYARKAGMTIGIADIRIPDTKGGILSAADAKVDQTTKLFRRGLITEDERYRKTIEIWNDATDEVTQAMMTGMTKFNPLTMMAVSGARGNTQQIRQLAGMRGLMADPSGRIIDLPIKANFREGLTVLDYFTSSHGARKGLADTALRTADSGYLTRRLVDVAQDVIVREYDCDVQTVDLGREMRRYSFLHKEHLKQEYKFAVLAEDILDAEDAIIFSEEMPFNASTLDKLLAADLTEVNLRTEEGGTEKVSLVYDEKEFREEMTALLEKEVAGKELAEAIYAIEDGSEIYPIGTKVNDAVIKAILDNGVKFVRVSLNLVDGIEVEAIKEGKVVIEPLRERLVGRVAAQDLVHPETKEVIVAKNEEFTETTAPEVEKYYDKVKIRSVLTCHAKYGVCCKCYGRNLGTGRPVEIGEAIGIVAAQSIGEPGTQLTMRTFHTGGVASSEDITQGLPRVEELFEARKPKRVAVISDISGFARVEERKTEPGVFDVTVENIDKDGNPIEVDKDGKPAKWEKTIPYGLKLIPSLEEYLKELHEVNEMRKNASEKERDGLADPDPVYVERGQRLTEGSVNPHDILRVLGVRATQRYLVYEVQKVYKSQGVEINDKHIEVIVRQMLHKIKIEDPGDSEWLPGESVEIREFERDNVRLAKEDKNPATGKFVLFGITKAALATESFLSAASFQETTRVLTEAAIKGKVDPLLGLKENVIIGKLIPAGTGMTRYRSIRVVHDDSKPSNPVAVKSEPETTAETTQAE